jgi:nitrate/nitrite transport system permease protein
MKNKDRAERLERRNSLVASDLATSDPAAYLEQQRQNTLADAKADEALSNLKSEIDAVWALRYPPLRQAQQELSKVAEEKQYLMKLEELLSASSRELKVAELAGMIDDYKLQLESADGRTAFTLGSRILTAEERLNSVETSSYAKPWTLPLQIVRSVFCVFTGFIIGSAIAIPLGILCGLSRVFMAAMTPFIAIFKPVSPIVWLPIALIIVGGFIPDPDKHWFIQGLWNAPLIGWMKINPAFIASAVTVALCSLWATLVNTALGVASIEKDHINVARVLKLGFWSRLFKIVIPSALPLIFAGLRISLGVGWMVLIAAELLSSSEGIGKFVWDQFNNGASDSFAKMVVVVFIVGIIGLLLDRIMIVFQRLVSFDGAPTAL